MNSHESHKTRFTLLHLYKKYGFDVNLIHSFVTGDKYTAIMLKNGNIGLAANLYGIKINNLDEIKNSDLNSTVFRTLYLAWLNAFINGNHQALSKTDFFDSYHFTNFQNIVLIGYSKSLTEKLLSLNKIISIFDNNSEYQGIKHQSELSDYVKTADCLIITATTLINDTYDEIVSQTDSSCEIFLLGPSSPMDNTLFDTQNLKAVFGMQFKKFDSELMDMVAKGAGTNDFKKIAFKSALYRSQNGSF
jgi:uncharacterized protein (DUF4213/DUF364 family)